MTLPADGLRTHRRPIVSIDVDFVSYQKAFEIVCNWQRSERREYVCLTNPHSVMLCGRDPAMGAATRRAGLVLPDGIGMILAAKLLGWPEEGRVTGPNLMLQMCDRGRAAGWRHFLIGGGPGVAEKLTERLTTSYPDLQIVGSCAPPFRELNADEDAQLVEFVNSHRPDIVWVGLGAPKQEKWMADHLGRVQATAMLGVGAAFDFHSGNVPWAPIWMRRYGLEWLHRLSQNPRRMWRRNLDSFSFLTAVCRQRIVGH